MTTSKGNKIIPYYVCETFVSMSPAERYSQLKAKNLCTTCIMPGAIKGPKHKCFFLNFCCPHSHATPMKVHVLLCDEHKNDEANKKLAEKFKEKFVKNCKQDLPHFSKNISLVSVTVHLLKSESNLAFAHLKSKPDVRESAIFLLQSIMIQGIRINLFFDNGCGDLVVRQSAGEKLSRIGSNGVGDHRTEALGFYSLCLPLHDGSNATLKRECVCQKLRPNSQFII